MAEETLIAAQPSDQPQNLYPDEGFKEMVEAGVFYGRKRSKTNPKMKPFVLTNRNGIEIVNLAKTTEQLEAATAFMKERARQANGIILFVATQPAASHVEEVARELGSPIVTRRWLGGTLTNFKIIGKRIEYFKKLKADMATNAFAQYTKKERLMIERDLERMQELLGGLEALTDHPAVLVVIDPALHLTAIREARILKIPVVALANTDADPSLLDRFVTGNTKARASINWFIDKIRAAILEGRSIAAAKEPENSAPAAGE
jgi:small subunit ribosomal protein S2